MIMNSRIDDRGKILMHQTTNEKNMAHKKKNVRKKECPVCEREFSWTKKLDKNWESMVYCSDQCRRIKKYEGLDHQKEDK